MAERHKRRFVDVTERALYLRTIPISAELPPRIVHVIAQHMVEREHPPGTVIQKTGDAVDAFHLIIEGGIALVRDGKPIGTLAAPQSVGFLDVIARSESTFDAVTVGATRTLELPGERLFEIMEDHFQLLTATLRYAAERLLYEMQELPEQALGFKAEKMPITIPDRPLDLVEKVLVMRAMAVFRKTNVNALAVLTDRMKEQRVPAGTEFFDVGQASAPSAFIVGGVVKCTAADGRTFRYEAGTAVGGVESLANKPRWYRAVAETDVVALMGNADTLVDLMEDNFELGVDFISMLGNGLKGLLARKAALAGAVAFQKKREVSGLGAVAVGA